MMAPRTHNLDDLLMLLVHNDPTLKGLRRILVSLSRFAVVFRDPGANATKRQAQTCFDMLKESDRKYVGVWDWDPDLGQSPKKICPLRGNAL